MKKIIEFNFGDDEYAIEENVMKAVRKLLLESKIAEFGSDYIQIKKNAHLIVEIIV